MAVNAARCCRALLSDLTFPHEYTGTRGPAAVSHIAEPEEAPSRSSHRRFVAWIGRTSDRGPFKGPCCPPGSQDTCPDIGRTVVRRPVFIE